MPEHQQVQQSTEPKSNAQKQVTTASPTQASNPYFIIQRAKINPKSLTHADIMQLQRTIGNRAVGMLLSSIRSSSAAQQATVQLQEIPAEEEKPLQGKFESIQRQDITEEEEPLQGKMAETVQRQDIPDEDEPLQSKFAEPIQLKEIPNEEEPPLQGRFENNPEQETCPSCSTFPIQRETENRTGMPNDLKAGVESLSGIDMGDVRVHYNSSKPADVGALAYTQGTDIHVAPGQEKHLPHEAWHVVQQAQGRVKPTMQLKDVLVNDDEGLEHEADGMGAKATTSMANITTKSIEPIVKPTQSPIQMVIIEYEGSDTVPDEAFDDEDLTKEQKNEVQRLHKQAQRYYLETAIRKAKEKYSSSEDIPLSPVTTEEIEGAQAELKEKTKGMRKGKKLQETRAKVLKKFRHIHSTKGLSTAMELAMGESSSKQGCGVLARSGSDTDRLFTMSTCAPLNAMAEDMDVEKGVTDTRTYFQTEGSHIHTEMSALYWHIVEGKELKALVISKPACPVCYSVLKAVGAVVADPTEPGEYSKEWRNPFSYSEPEEKERYKDIIKIIDAAAREHATVKGLKLHLCGS